MCFIEISCVVKTASLLLVVGTSVLYFVSHSSLFEICERVVRIVLRRTHSKRAVLSPINWHVFSETSEALSLRILKGKREEGVNDKINLQLWMKLLNNFWSCLSLSTCRNSAVIIWVPFVKLHSASSFLSLSKFSHSNM